MRKQAFIVFLVSMSIIMASGCTKESQNPLKDLKKIGNKMNSFKHIEYSYVINITTSYSGEWEPNSGKIYFERNTFDTICGMNFYSTNVPYKVFYNGESIVTMNESDSSINKSPLVRFENGHGTAYPQLEMSFCAIQRFLTDSCLEFQIDSIVQNDTLYMNQECTYYSFWANEKFIDIHKGLNKYNKKVELIILKNNSLPLYYSQNKPTKNGNRTEFFRSEVHFTNYSKDIKYPSTLFSIEAIPEYYDWTKISYLVKTLPNNKLAPDWTLPIIGGDSLSLSELLGKYVLLDFWFIGCGACLESIPTLNMINEKYENNLEVVGINCLSDNKERIEDYCSNRGMTYSNLWKGSSISKDYLVTAAPIFYLIDKEGKIVYSQKGHDSIKLINNIEHHLN